MSGASGLFGVVLKPVAEEALLRLHRRTAVVRARLLVGRLREPADPGVPERTVVPLKLEGPLFRIAAGLEHAEDLVADLAAGFARLRG